MAEVVVRVALSVRRGRHGSLSHREDMGCCLAASMKRTYSASLSLSLCSFSMLAA